MNKAKVKFNSLILLLAVILLLIKYTGTFMPIPLQAITLIVILFGILNFIINKNEVHDIIKNPILIFIILLSITIIWTEAFEYGSSKLYQLYGMFFSIVLITNVIYYNQKLFYLLISLIFGAVALYLILFNSDVIMNVIVLGESGGRYRIVEESNSNVVSIFFSLGFLSSIICFKFKKSRYLKTTFILIALLFIVLLFLTGSRGSLLSIIFTFLLFYFINKTRSLFKTFLLFLTFLIVTSSFIRTILISLTPIVPDALSVFFNERYLSENAFRSITAREELINLAITGYSNSDIFSLLFGNGIGSYGYLLNGFDARGYPHNILLELLYEFGIINLIFFISLVFLIFKKYLYNIDMFKNNPNKYLLLFFIFLLLNAFTTGDLASNFLLFNFMALLFYMLNNTKYKIKFK